MLFAEGQKSSSRPSSSGETVLDFPGPALVGLSKGATALVVGTRGHHEQTSLLLGSVSEHVVHCATCTTIVVR